MNEPVLKAPAPRLPQIFLCERCRVNQTEHTCEWCNMELCEKCMWTHERECGDSK
jgi:hypothetical protein